jgi:alkanesulfonate monooxygenase SsuD/methylene tetrahydromethanopterin reductase-like flavin-dependent oxidoreductase (luciferase family)
MHFGVSMFHTDYSIPAVELARALEVRGFESMWAPEHSHIPVPRRTPFPGGGEVPKPYYEVMDPFVVLSAAAAVTKTLKLATGVCLVVQRDPIQTAKLVASIDQVSAGASSSALAAAGMPRKSRTMGRPSKPASS